MKIVTVRNFLIPMIILVGLLSSLGKSDISNRPAVCDFLRESLNSISSYIKPMDSQVKSKMWRYSFRGLAFTLIKKAEMDKKSTFKTDRLIRKIKAKREEYAELRHMDVNRFNDYVDQKLADQIEFGRMVEEKEELSNAKGKEIEDEKQQLKEILKFLKEDPSMKEKKIDVKMTFLEELEVILNQLVLNTEINEITINFLERIEKFLPKEENEIQKNIDNFKKLANEIFAIDKLLWAHKTYKNKLSGLNVESSELKTRLAKIQARRTELDIEANKSKEVCINAIKPVVESTKYEITQEPEFIKYTNQLNKVKALIKEDYNIKQTIKEILYYSDINDKEIILNAWKKYRIYPNELFSLDENIDAMERIIQMTNSSREESDEDIREVYHDESLNEDLNFISEENEKRKEEIEAVLIPKKDLRKVIAEIIALEKKFDIHLAKLFAEIQGAKDDEKSAHRCLSPNQLSVYLYYINISQVIFSQEGFLKVFLRELGDNKYSADIVKQLFTDITPTDYSNTTVMKSRDAVSFEPDGRNIAAKEYSVVFAGQYDVVFEGKDNTDLEVHTGIYYKMMSGIGFSKDFVLDLAKETGFGIIFDTLAASLLLMLGAGVGFGLGIGLASTLIASFLVFIVQIFFTWIYDHRGNIMNFINSFLDCIAKVYTALLGNEIASLDIDRELYKTEHELEVATLTAEYNVSADVIPREEYYGVLLEGFDRIIESDLESRKKLRLMLL